jgi:hypothetical protein
MGRYQGFEQQRCPSSSSFFVLSTWMSFLVRSSLPGTSLCAVALAVVLHRTPASAATAVPSTAASSCPAASTSLTAGRGPDKGKVNGDGLVQQLSVVGIVNGGSCFLQCVVFNQCVALNMPKSRCQHFCMIQWPGKQSCRVFLDHPNAQLSSIFFEDLERTLT